MNIAKQKQNSRDKGSVFFFFNFIYKCFLLVIQVVCLFVVTHEYVQERELKIEKKGDTHTQANSHEISNKLFSRNKSKNNFE